MNKRVLVIAAHADDEAFGCSGTMLRHVAEGDEVHEIFMTNGVGARNEGDSKIAERLSMASKAAEVIGVTSVESHDFPDNRMDSVPLLEIVQSLETRISSIKPDVIYTHHHCDLNIDHRVTHEAVMTACRPVPDSHVREIFAFEVLSSTEWHISGFESFDPNMFVDISAVMESKMKVLDIYGEELRQPPHSRSMENLVRLNALRGNSVGLDYAEAFKILRYLR